ncbi:hypothetical protein GCM10027051_32990 [Niabella terrae]
MRFRGRFTVGCNGLGICDGAEIAFRQPSFALKLNKIAKVEHLTSSRTMANTLYAVNFAFAIRIFVVIKLKVLEEITKENIVEPINQNKIELSSTQTKLCLPVINRIYKK